jgi:putative transposase
MDFVHDQLATGNKIRVLTVVDIFSRYSPVVDPRFTTVATMWSKRWKGPAPRLDIHEPSASIRDRSSSLAIWICRRTPMASRWTSVGREKPTDNAFIEAFNGRFRAECLNTHWFLTLEDARAKMEDWLRYYNEERPHGAIGNIPPMTLLNHGGATTPPP